MTEGQPTSEHDLDWYGTPAIAWERVRAVLDGDLTTGGNGSGSRQP